MNVHGRYGIEAELLRGTNAATLLQVSWFIFYLQVSRRSILRAEHFLLSEQVLQASRNPFGDLKFAIQKARAIRRPFM